MIFGSVHGSANQVRAHAPLLESPRNDYPLHRATEHMSITPSLLPRAVCPSTAEKLLGTQPTDIGLTRDKGALMRTCMSNIA
jgi:hypothetical protein